MVLAHVSRNKISASRRRRGRTAVATRTLREPSSAGGAGTGCVGDSAAGTAPGPTSRSGSLVGSSGTVGSSAAADDISIISRAHERLEKIAQFAAAPPRVGDRGPFGLVALAHARIVAGAEGRENAGGMWRTAAQSEKQRLRPV